MRNSAPQFVASATSSFAFVSASLAELFCLIGNSKGISYQTKKLPSCILGREPALRVTTWVRSRLAAKASVSTGNSDTPARLRALPSHPNAVRQSGAQLQDHLLLQLLHSFSASGALCGFTCGILFSSLLLSLLFPGTPEILVFSHSTMFSGGCQPQGISKPPTRHHSPSIFATVALPFKLLSRTLPLENRKSLIS